VTGVARRIAPVDVAAYARRRAAVAPVVATVLLLCVPAGSAGPGGSGTGSSGTGAVVTPADVASGLLVLWCAVRLLRARARTAAAPPRGPYEAAHTRRLTPAAALVLGAPAVAFAVATAASTDPSASLTGFVRYLQLFVLVPGAVALSLPRRADFRLVCAAVVLLALVEGAVGVVQYATGSGASYMGEDVRAVGTFGALDVMGMSTVVGYGLVAALAVGLNFRASGPRWVRPCALGCAAALLVPLALSYSRGAWIATAVACAGLLALRGLRTAVPVLAALLAAGVVLVGGFGVGSAEIGERAGSIAEVSAAPDRSVTDRYSLWDAAAAIWRDAPLTGTGPKNFPEQRDGHADLGLSSGSDAAGAGLRFQREPLLSPHNMYLLLLSEQGLAGFAALAGGWAALLVCALRRLRTSTRGERRPGTGTGAGADRGADRGADCGAVAVGLLGWQLVDFLYSDIGGPSTVLTAVVLGLVVRWALGPGQLGAPADESAPPRSTAPSSASTYAAASSATGAPTAVAEAGLRAAAAQRAAAAPGGGGPR